MCIPFPRSQLERHISYPVELGMANLPGVKEIRSVSKSGRSVGVAEINAWGGYVKEYVIAIDSKKPLALIACQRFAELDTFTLKFL